MSVAAGPRVDRDLLRELSVRSDAPGLRRLAGHATALAATAAAVVVASGTPWVVPAWLAEGVVLGHVFAAQHECAHRTAFRSPWLNRVVGTAAGILTAVAPTHFRHEHLAHHRWTRDAVRDPEFVRMPTSVGSYLWTLTGLPYWAWTIRTYATHAAGRLAPGEDTWVSPEARPAVFREARLLSSVYLAAILVPLATGWWWPLTLWAIPRVLGEPVQRVIRWAEHTGLPEDPDPAIGTRSLRTVAPLRWLAWNMNFHAAHHRAPSVPFHALPRWSREWDAATAVGPPPGGYLAANRAMITKLKRSTGAPLSALP